MRVHARQTIVKELSLEEAKFFLEANHRQGSVTSNGGILSFGLFHEHEVVAVVQFCNPRTEGKKRKYTIELLRLAFKAGVRVPGGASKLLSHYRNTYNPADIFTYQDTTGEVTDVYEHCGFTLVSQARKKEYLVAPGKTLATAKRNEYFSVGHVTRNGPDRILGIKLGEVFHSNGERKNNIEIFIEELNWHLEATSGDRVYEWVSGNKAYYTYKITATDSDKYYYGVRGVPTSRANEEDCLRDNYWGSGGAKFKNWKEKHKPNLVKEILAIHKRKAHAYAQEEKLVGDRYRTDPLCLNSINGGNKTIRRSGSPQTVMVESCSTHGKTPHVNGFCRKCASANRTNIRACPVHGETKHQGAACYKCSQEKTHHTGTCLTHGEAPFMGERCRLCIAERANSEQDCPIHGLTPFHGDSCRKCDGASRTSTQACPVHGEVKHQGNSCYACMTAERNTAKTCAAHGDVSFTGDSCYKCSTASRHSEGKCSKHGLTKFSGATCAKCTAEKSISLGDCTIHGEVKLRAGKCSKCILAEQYTDEACPTHGLSRHRAGKCCRCKTAARKLIKGSGGRPKKPTPNIFTGSSADKTKAKITALRGNAVPWKKIAEEFGVKIHELKTFAVSVDLYTHRAQDGS